MISAETGLEEVPIEVIEKNYNYMQNQIVNVRPRIWFVPHLKRGIVYEATEMMVLRQHKIAGLLVGTPRHFQSQNVFFSTPVALCLEEINICLKHDLADVYDESEPFIPASEEEINEHKKQRQNDSDVWMAARRKEIEAKHAPKEQNDRTRKLIDDDLRGIMDAYSVDVNVLAKRKRKDLKKLTFESFRTLYCTNDKSQILRFSVFEDLWKQNYFLTDGSKFGGYYLCYAGDPMLFHAAFVVILRDHDQNLSPLDIVSFGRLGVSVKKSALLASLQPKNGKNNSTTTTVNTNNTNNNNNNNNIFRENDFTVKYFSIEWLGVT